MKKIQWKPQLIKSLKIAAAAFLAIALAGELHLKYPATAGIIKVLSIQNTKRETLKSAGRRWLAFLCAMVISGGFFVLVGYNLWAFGAYLFLFALLCLCVGWTEAIAMDSVLITHFLTEQSMAPELIANEVLLLFIGTGMGIGVNLYLRRKEAQFELLSGEADSQMKGILERMSRRLPQEDRSGYGSGCFSRLQDAISAAKECALSNYGNTLGAGGAYELAYMEMRERQSALLREIYENILRIQYLPRQAEQVAGLLGQIGREFHRDNTAAELSENLEELFSRMKEEPLPESREEFEARAILFYILMQIRQFLELKRQFAHDYEDRLREPFAS